MNAFATIVEVVEVAALIVLVIYLIRIIRDRDDSEPRSAIIDRNLAELADFHRVLVSSQDIARIWQDGREDRRLNDIDQERFSLLANDYLSILANQRQRAESIGDDALVEAATLKLIDVLQLNPGLLPEWEEIAHEVATIELREAVSKAMNPVDLEVEADAETAPEPVTVSVEAQNPEPAEPQAAEETASLQEAEAATEEPVTKKSVQQDEAVEPLAEDSSGHDEDTEVTPVSAAAPALSEAADDSNPAENKPQQKASVEESVQETRNLEAVGAKAS
ncbi:MAG: hypothetical protein R3F50_04390 [Gammaproteobacteria bacterium]|jgi:hypothetical protein